MIRQSQLQTGERPWPVHECPPWCHVCPLLAGGAVMPMCWGTVTGNVDELDLSACTCQPADPAVAQRDLALRTETLIQLLRNKRRERIVKKALLTRLVAMVGTLRFWTHTDLRRNAPELEALVSELVNAFVEGASV